jgi:hypothetical protein
MKKILSLAISTLVPVLMLSACGAGGTAPTDAAAASYTAAAQTVNAAQTAANAASSTPLPSLTSVPQPSPTLKLTSIPTRAATRPVVPDVSACDNSAYVNDVSIPDGTVFGPVESFIKTWTIQNIGTCDWTTAYALASQSGNAMDGSITKLSDTVKAGEKVDISVGMWTPAVAGSYVGYWRMKNAAGTFFGDSVFVSIVVGKGAVTATPK